MKIKNVEKKVCFIILHYGENVNITLEAIRSIKNLEKFDETDIIVVCNGNEFDISLYIYKEFKNNIDVIVLQENQGFSKGNNIGYEYAKKKNKYDFIVFINNDIVIEQKKFIEYLYEIYDRHKFYVCGPDIYVPYKTYHSSPMADTILSLEDVDKEIEKKQKLIKEYSKQLSFKVLKLYLMEAFAGRNQFYLFAKLWRQFKNNNKKYKEEQSNVVLQGSCLIFSKDYIVCNDKAFLPEVFLYFEEYYLALRCKKNNWEMFYTKHLQVLHMHRGSSGLIGMKYRDYCNKKINISETYILAAEEMKEVLKNKGIINSKKDEV